MDRLTNKHLLILGLARQGIALARFAVGVGAKVTVSDLSPADKLAEAMADLDGLEVEFVLGSHPPSLLEKCDAVAISGGVPADAPFVKAARAKGISITNDSQELIRRIPTKQTVGITGSAGKTTTTALVGHILRTANVPTWVGGNIGYPLIQDLDRIEPHDVVVQELSSFQLQVWEQSPAIAAVTNITPNHLDRHKTLENYTLAKRRILDFQSENDIAILNRDDKGAFDLAPVVKGRLRSFSLREAVNDGATLKNGRILIRSGMREIPIMAARHVPLIGQHNLANVLAAITIATAVDEKIGPAALSHAIRTFDAVPHRLELVAEKSGVRFINDSIATAPERALAGLQALEGNPIVLLAGGKDKNMVWEPWAQTVSQQIKSVVLFGALKDVLAQKLSEAGRTEAVYVVDSVSDAVDKSIDLAKRGDTVLLSPGGTSYDAFKDFEE
ncbi:MAG: UDP-N-acetylmuramoyl-L-alanine--D-glutamate ligase, partial [Chloroflexota bacterium]